MQPLDRNLGRLNRCPDAQALLPEYVEGELSPLESRRLEGHLTLCASCRHEEAQCRVVFGALRSPRELAPHGDLYAGFAAKLSRCERRPSTRQLQLRWAAVSALVLVMGGASASYVRTLLSTPKPVSPQFASIDPRVHAVKQIHPPEKNVAVKTDKTEPELKFEWKSVGPTQSSANTQPDPFNPNRLVQSDIGRKGMAVAAGPGDDRPSSGHGHANRPKLAIDERHGFLGVKPIYGPSAEQIIVQKRHEETVAQYGDPQPTQDASSAQDDRTEPVRPIVVPENPDAQGSVATIPIRRPVTMTPSDDSVVMVNGKRTDVKTSVGYDKRGRPVLVKVNIIAKPAKEEVDRSK